jgi:hypothetical protein
LIDGPGAAIVKFRVNKGELFHETRRLQLPGEEAGGLPETSMDQLKHQVPADATGFQVPDLYAAPSGEYHVADATSPELAPVTLNQTQAF